MRKRWIALPLVLAAAAYWAWPYAGAYKIAKAVERHDADAVAARIDAPALKKSLVRQVVRAYLRESGRGEKLGALGRGMAVSVGTTVADPYLNQLLSPATLTALLADGHMAPVTIENRTLTFDQTLPSLPKALGGNIAAVLTGSSFESPTTFLLHVPGGQGDAEGYGVELALDGLTWKVAGLELPAPLLDRIAADIVSRENAKQAS